MPSLESAPSHPWRAFVALLIFLAVLAAVVALARGSAPAIAVSGLPPAIGGHRSLTVTVAAATGVAAVHAWYEQQGRRFPLADQARPGHRWFTRGGLPRQMTLVLPAGRLDHPGLSDGAAQLVVEASAGNLRGSTARLERTVTLRSLPPQIAVLSGEIYLNQGGCELAVYRLSPATADSGVAIAGVTFPGHALPGAPAGTMFSLFSFPWNAPADATAEVVARDAAGNEAMTSLPVKTFPRTWRTRVLDIDDAYIARVVMPIIANTPQLSDRGSPLADFLLVNRNLRTEDARELRAATQSSAENFLWHGAFLELAHAATEAEFADHRSYRYQGRIVDDEYHLGYDLAAVRHTPVLAANDGRVVWTKYFGIYGNTVLIDHGYGLMSLYAHLNDFTVHPGQTVTRGQLIAHTDSTGLAGGDHLHFSMLLDGVQVNPLEWWDPRWIETHIDAQLQPFTSATTPP